jgi:hypothetical protein
VPNKTPFLDGFPTFLFGRAKASGQALLRKVRKTLIDRCPGQLSSLFAEVIAPALVVSLAMNRRVRHFPDEVTFWAFLSQTLSEDRSCARAVAEVQSWRLDHGQSLPSADTSSYCKARQRLPMTMLEAVHEDLRNSLSRQTPTELLWHGHVVKAIDGSSVQLPDTPENQLVFPQPSNQKPGCGFPVMQFGALINLCNGAWEQFVVSEMTIHDHKLLHAMLPYIACNEVLLADRAFCSYEMMARTAGQGAWMVARLHQARTNDWRKGKKAGPNQRIVTWCKPSQPAGSCLSREQWAQLPEQIQVRLIRVRARDRDGKLKTMFLATTLMDTVRYPEEDIAALYFQRWEIELRLRDLKTTMGMELLRTQTPEMARKELTMFVIAYNALRLLMLKASLECGAALWRISFKGTIQVVATWNGRFSRLHHKPKSRSELFSELLGQIAQRKVPLRPGRQEPRAIKRRPKPFPRLTTPRKQFQDELRRNAALSENRMAA